MTDLNENVQPSETNSCNADAEPTKPCFPAFDIEAARQHLKLLGYKEGDKVKINCLYHRSDPRNVKGGGRQLESTFPNLPWKEIQKNQMQGRCVYFAPNGAFKKAEVTECRVIFSESDEGTIEKQLINWRSKSLPDPTIELFSGSKSVHQYLRLNSPCTPQQFTELQDDLAAHLGNGADKSLGDPNQLMRLAGAWHVSPDKDPVRVEFISQLGDTYNYEDLRKLIPRAQKEEKATPNHTTEEKANEMLNFVQYLNGFQENGRAGWYTAECPLSHKHHSGNHSQDSLHVEAETGAYKCHAGCDSKDVWQAARKVAIDNGYKPKKSNDVGKNMSDSQVFKNALTEICKESDPELVVLKKAEVATTFRVNVQEINRLIKQRDEVKEAKHAENYVLDTASLFEEDEAEDFLVPGMLPRAGTAIFAGDPKTGKTLLAYELAYAVATGGEFLGEKVPQGKVLLFQIERPKKNSQRLVRRGFTKELLDSSVKILTKYSPEILKQELEADKYTLVIIDSLTAINVDTGVSERSKEYADPIYKMQPLIEKANATCILIHHLNKNNEAQGVRQLRGSSAIAGAVWGCFVLKHVLKQDPYNKKKFTIDPNETHRTLELVGLQDAGGTSLDIELNTENYSWVNHGELGLAREDVEARRTMKERIQQALFINYPNGLTGVEIKEVLGITSDTDYATMRKTLARMDDKREITAKPNPKKHSSRLYLLPPLVYIQMSHNLTQTHTQQASQECDNLCDTSSVTLSVSSLSAPASFGTATLSLGLSQKLSHNSNPYQEGDTVKLCDTSTNTEGGCVSSENNNTPANQKPVNNKVAIRAGDRVKVNLPGHKLSSQVLTVVEVEDEGSGDLAILHLETVAYRSRGEKHQLYAHQVKKLPRIN